MYSKHEQVVKIMEVLNGLPFKVIDDRNNTIIFILTSRALEIISVGENTIRKSIQYANDLKEDTFSLSQALIDLGVYIENLDIQATVLELLHREHRYFSHLVTEPIKNMSMSYQVGYRNVLDRVFGVI